MAVNTRNIMMMEQRFRKDLVVGIAMTLPMKLALMEAAAQERVPLSVFVRNAVFDYLQDTQPDFFENVYLRCLTEQTERIINEDD